MRRAILPLAALFSLTMIGSSAFARPATDDVALVAAAQAELAGRLIAGASNASAVVASPMGLAFAFESIESGASPAMKIAAAKALGFGREPALRAFAALSAARQRLSGADESFQFGARLIFSPAQPPSAKAIAALDAKGVEHTIADLSNSDDVKAVDDWVSAKTRGLVPAILGAPVRDPGLVALNALHFKGAWRSPFDVKMTAPAPFHGADHKGDGEVAMMRLPQATRLFRSDKRFIAIDLPFKHERYSLVVVTSTDKPLAASAFRSVTGWLSGEKFKDQQGDLALPRFTISETNDFLPSLDRAGLGSERRKPDALAGFGAPTLISRVLQRATLVVAEEGAEAAAATAIVTTRSLEEVSAVHMVVDKPFIYALRDKETGLIVMAGYVGSAAMTNSP